MRNVIIGLALFLAQLLVCFLGTAVWGKWINPLVFLLVSMAIPFWYIQQLTQERAKSQATETAPGRWWIWALAGLFFMALPYEELRKSFVAFAVPRDYSDVIPQLETLYHRFRDGIFPYAPVDMGTYQPYPVYMPLHWLPIAITDWLGIDSRWLGYGFLGLAAAVFSFAIAKNTQHWIPRVMSALLPSLAMWAYILWGGMDIPVSHELIIAAYYLLLATGLLLRNPWVTGLALIACILSRYTLAFWLPLFALLMWFYAPKKQSFATWGAVLTAFLLLYFIPFYLKDTSILSTGIAYHNHAAIDEWKGYGEPPVSWSFERGIYFAPHLKALFSGDMAHRVTMSRVVQGSLMLVLCFGGFFFYQRRWRSKMEWHDYSLLMLYLIIASFYFFGPLTYRYYLIVLFMLSAALIARVLSHSSGNDQVEASTPT